MSIYDILRDIATQVPETTGGRHATAEELVALEEGVLDRASADELLGHIASCSDCGNRLDNLMRLSIQWEGDEGTRRFDRIRSRLLTGIQPEITPSSAGSERNVYAPAPSDIHLSKPLLRSHLDALLSSGRGHRALEQLRSDTFNLARFIAEFDLLPRFAIGSVQSSNDAIDQVDFDSDIPLTLNSGEQNPIHDITTIILRPVSVTEWELYEQTEESVTLTQDTEKVTGILNAWKYTLEWMMLNS